MIKSLVALGALLVPAVATAGTPCSTRNTVLEHLATKFKEAPVAIGLANNGTLLELLTSGNGSTWTIIATRPDGQSCLVAAGEDWQDHDKVVSRDPEI